MSASLNHLFNRFIQKADSFNKETPSIAQRLTIFVGKIELKQARLCLKCKSLIAFLILYKMIIKCYHAYICSKTVLFV